MHTRFHTTLHSFEDNTKAVDRLLDFGNEILKVAVGALQIEPAVMNTLPYKERNQLEKRLTLLKNIRPESLEPEYQAMFNQCVVLLVSYFDSALHTLFRQGVAAALASGATVPAASEELKISWRGVSQAEGEREFLFADLLISQHDISFQDMQSISRAFKNQLEISIERTPDTHNVILGQAARHAIVHAGGIIDPIMVRQVANAKPRTLMKSLTPDAVIRFSPEDVRVLTGSMTTYVQRVAKLLDEASAQWAEASASPSG